MREIIKKLNAMDIKTYACCCGHKKYPTTIIVRNNEGAYWDYMSGKVVPRTRRFYSKDDDGYYYIREVVNK